MNDAGRSLWTYLRPYRRTLVLGVLLLLATNACDKAIPWLLQHAIDALRDGDATVVRNFALVVIAIAAVMWGFRTFSRILIFNVGRDIEYDLRNELLGRVHELGPSFFRRMPTGEIMSRATNDLGQVRLLVGFGALNVVNTIVAYAAALALMLAISPKLTLYALIPYPLFLIVARVFSRAVFVRSRDAAEAVAKLADRAQENLTGVRVVRAYGLEEHEERRFDEANREAIQANMQLVVLRGLMWPVLMGIGSIGTLIVIWTGGMMVLDGELSVGEFAAFNAYLGQLVWPTLALGFILSVVQRGRASYERVREVIDAEADVADRAGAVAAGREGALSVRRLRFAHGPRTVLDDVTFDVPAGSSLAVVGPTGSGKSTLAALLPRLLPVPERSVFLDGDDVTNVRLRELRKAVGYAQQEPFLFSTTVARNIGFALDDPSAPDAEQRVRAAAREAAILDEIEGLPDGFDTVVGERGVQLSGGQKQRVALARALLNEPTVLVLDDPLSAVDARTESVILKALDRAGEGRTLILITHRIAAARRTESIVVLDEGRVVERGTHDELVKTGGIYARLAARQRLESELEEIAEAVANPAQPAEVGS